MACSPLVAGVDDQGYRPVDDAAVLMMHCSYGRAQALLVLATEEPARAGSCTARGRGRVVEVGRVEQVD